MTHYQAPLEDLMFVFFDLWGATKIYANLPPYQDLDRDTVQQVFQAGGEFASNVLAPLRAPGDEHGCRYDASGQTVTAPPGFKTAYEQFIANGWPGLSADPDFGGQGLPVAVNQALYEMLNAANQAWAMYPGLTHGAYECIHAHGSDEQKQCYLPKLVSGEWTGTMCLTEAHCGTDLGLLRTQAVPGDSPNEYRLTGNKIFISSGEHDMTENIVHLVLARLPGAPAGVKGISLFIVPKYLPQADGSLGERNAIHCGGIEHKMGIHGNATCQMHLDGARGWLLGEAHRGLSAMFVMMNVARLGVAVQSLGLMDAAYQQAAKYARERLQMRALSGTKHPDLEADPIIVHPDVRRQLLTARVYAEASRALIIWTALRVDEELHHPDSVVRAEAAADVALLTPVCKALVTDNAWQACSGCLQVFGGHGYIREWGMEQYLRDARINMIYEGTNAIQALDLLGRKVLADGGDQFRRFRDGIQQRLQSMKTNAPMDVQGFIDDTLDAIEQISRLTTEIGMKAMLKRDQVGASSVPYLRAVGHVLYAYVWICTADAVGRAGGRDTPLGQRKWPLITFYFQHLFPEVQWNIQQAKASVDSLLSPPEHFF